jgi:hypothetical protein
VKIRKNKNKILDMSGFTTLFPTFKNHNCKDFYPFTITHILTDNGLEFADKFVTKDKQGSG